MADALEPPIDFSAGDLVVDLPHAALIAHVLHRDVAPGMPVTVLAEDEALGLALLRLDGVAEHAARIATEDPATVAALKGELKEAYRDLDTVLRRLRRWFSERHGGWQPAMGKNRFVNGVIGLPQSKPLWLTDPQPAAPDRFVMPAADPDAGRGVRVGVLDTGLYPHPALAGHYEATPDSLHTPPPDAVAPAWAGHATSVAGLIAAQAPAATLVVRRVLADDTGGASAWAVARAIAGFADAGIHILNLSLGCRTVDGVEPLVLSRAVRRLGPAVLVVAAAGNHGHTDYAEAPVWPAALPGVIAVGAVAGSAGSAGGAGGAGGAVPAAFSPDRPWVACTAPGVDVPSTFLYARVAILPEGADDAPAAPVPTEFHGYARWSGTSFAAATASGRVGARTVPGRTSAAAALRQILDTGDPVLRRFTWTP